MLTEAKNCLKVLAWQPKEEMLFPLMAFSFPDQ